MPNIELTTATNQQKTDIRNAIDALGAALDASGNMVGVVGPRGEVVTSVSVKAFGAKGDGVADDTAAVQAAIDSVEALGGTLLFPPGKYLLTSQVTINRTYAPAGSNFVGERNLVISGYGAEIRTTGAISALDVRGGWAPNANCVIEGFTIYHRGNTQAVAGIRMIGAGLVTCREISVAVGITLPAGYAAFKLENGTPSNDDTGCFWCVIDQCIVRPWDGLDMPASSFGVQALGAANALTVKGCVFSGATTHVQLAAHAGQSTSPNAVVIDGNFFEAPVGATAINLVSSDPVYHVTGTRITNNRFESLSIGVSLSGTGTTVQIPTYLASNYVDTTVATYLSNPLGIPVVALDSALVGSELGPAQFFNKNGLRVRVNGGAYDSLTVVAAGLNRGAVLETQSGVFLGRLAYSNAAGGNGMQLAGSFSPDYRPLTIKGLQGIAARDTAANNLAGTSAFSASTTRVVTLPVAEANASYLIFLEAQANQRLWISARTASDFTVTSDVSSSNSFGWLLIRHL